MEAELINLSLRIGYNCFWTDKEIIFPDHGVAFDNEGIYTMHKPINRTTLDGIRRIADKWLELQKIDAFK